MPEVTTLGNQAQTPSATAPATNAQTTDYQAMYETLLGEHNTTTQELNALRVQHDRLKGTQSATDRARTELQAQLEAATQQVATLQPVQQSYNELQTRFADVQNQAAQVPQLQTELERMRVVSEYAAQTPAMAVLAANNALPQADTIEDFRAKLDAMAQGLNAMTANGVMQTLQGAQPSNAPTPIVNERTVRVVDAEMAEAVRHNDWNKYHELADERLTLLMK